LKDRSGEIWIGSRDQGLNKFNPGRQSFKSVGNEPDKKIRLDNEEVRDIIEISPGIFWTTPHSKGLRIYNQKENHFSLLNKDPFNKNQKFLGSTLFKDSRNNIWIGTWSHGFYQYNVSTNRLIYLQHIPGKASSFLNKFISAFQEDSRGRIWVATVEGIIIINRDNPTSDDVSVIPSLQYGKNDCCRDWAFNICRDRKGDMWLATRSEGLKHYNITTGVITTYKSDINDVRTIGSDRVYTVYEDSKGRIWAGASSGGLHLFEPKTNSFQHYTVKDGLCNNAVVGIVEDKKGDLWLTTQFGLSRFSPNNKVFHNYYVQNGLPSNEFIMNTIGYSPSLDKVYTATKKGLVFFDPDDLTTNSYIPPVWITSIKKYRNWLASFY
jgi:ligand-binding sensor domain-containing protein